MHQGIDKIGITTKAFIVSQDHKLRVHPMSYHPNAVEKVEEPLLFNKQRGAKASHNGLNAARYSLSINNTGALILFNPSKALHPYHLTNSEGDIQQVWDYIREDIKTEAGVILPPDNELKLAHVDMAENQIMDYSIIQYAPLFHSLTGKYMDSKSYPESYYFGSDARQINFYNKTKEVNLRQEGIEIEPNLMRAEFRALVPDSVKAIYKLNDLSTFLNVGAEYRIERHRTTLRKTLFFDGNRADQLNIFPTDYALERQALTHLIETEGRGAFEQWRGDHGMDKLLEMFGTLKEIRAFLMATGKITEQHSRKIINKWQKGIQRRAFLQTKNQKLSFTKMYHEVYTKFAV